MDNSQRVKVFQTRTEVAHNSCCIGFTEGFLATNTSEQLSSSHQLHDKIHVSRSFKDFYHGDTVFMMDLKKTERRKNSDGNDYDLSQNTNFFFQHFDFLSNFRLVDHFDGNFCPSFLFNSTKYSRKKTSTFKDDERFSKSQKTEIIIPSFSLNV